MTTFEQLIAGSQPEPTELKKALLLHDWRIVVDVPDGTYNARAYFDLGGKRREYRSAGILYVDPQFRWLYTSQKFYRLGKRLGADHE
jgi:hypothetical protein